MTFDELKEKAHGLPRKPGVYIMMDQSGTVIYVGKAKVLRNRVSQYFYDLASHGPKTRAMVSQIDHFDIIVVNSEFEALVLECATIKRYQPKYNILLKDDKGYPYIRLDVKSPYPRFSLASRVEEDGAKYFGPYGSRGHTYQIVDAICRALKLPTCHRQFPRDIGKDRPCLNHHMGQCLGWCQGGLLDEAAYQALIRQAVRLLEGKYDQVAAELQGEMEQAAEELRFEKAAELRDRMKAIQLLGTRQKVTAMTRADTDVVGFFRGEAKSCFAVLHYGEGELTHKEIQLVDTPMEGTEEELLTELIPQYYMARGTYPRVVLLPLDLEESYHLDKFLTQQAGRRVEVITPKRGAKMDLIRLANRNAQEEAERQTSREERQNKTLELLGKLMGLEKGPERLESYDISNTGASDIVASMVVFQHGRPLKRDYRRFILKDMTGPDDYASMEQVLTRRFRRYLEGDEKFSALPDALLIDGGVTHANVAVRVLKEMKLSIPVFGMVKDDRHRTRALVTPAGAEIGIGQYQTVFALIGQIQEETHRFAITFHKERHSKSATRSQLDGIPGLGEKRKKALLKHYKSVKAIAAAPLEELITLVPKPVAMAVFHKFHGGPEGDSPDSSHKEAQVCE
jgi:excinuclease ABC subunit C